MAKLINLDKIKNYMSFAFQKAYAERGISANRSIQHTIAWLWLAGENELLKWVEDEYENNYHSYGLPILIRIAQHFEIPIPNP